MKNLMMIALMILVVACGANKDKTDPYLFNVSTLNKQWDFSQVVGQSQNQIMFDSIDLTDMNNIRVNQLKRNGVVSDCVYTGLNKPFNEFYGVIELTYVSGDSFVCSQLTTGISYNAVNDIRKGYEYMEVAGLELR